MAGVAFLKSRCFEFDTKIIRGIRCLSYIRLLQPNYAG